MPAGDVLGIGLSGTLSTQREMATASHNIANANTEGYSRQRVTKTTRNPQQLSNGALGRGVQISSVKRMHDEFLTTNVRDNTSLTNSFKTGHQLTSQVDNLLSDPKAGVGIVLQDFFDSVNGVANEPGSTTARQVMISTANTLTNRLHNIDSRLQDLRLASNKQTKLITNDINHISATIGKLNQSITLAQQSTGQPANDLLDKRDILLQELSEKINVSTKEQDDGAINVFIGNGQTLVLGIQSSKLQVISNEFDTSKVDVVFVGNNSKTNITKFISGGDLGGILEFQHDIVDDTQNELGRISLALAVTFNEQHESGLDLKSNYGEKFFNGLDSALPEVIAGTGNRGNSHLSAQITDVTKVTTSDYRLEYTDSQYHLIRLNDNVTVKDFSSLPNEISEDGFSLKLESGDSIVEGDSFLIRPTRLAAKNIEVLISDTNKIAASAPVRSISSINNLGDGRLELSFIDVNNLDEENEKTVDFNDDGSVKISIEGEQSTSKIAFSVDDVSDGNNGPSNITIKILDNNRLQIIDNSNPDSSKILSEAISYNANENLMLTPVLNGKQLSVSAKLKGNLVAGDTFKIEINKDASGDNTNILSLARLHRANNLIEGRVNYNESYAELVSKVGSRTHELDVNAEAQQALLNQSVLEKETVSGVNLDEEATKLLKLQTQFKANAQVIASADKMFQDLMAVLRR
ncbi:MAG: flagellar hook-associated protein FlgK [Gammaproteobacteria bacterium]